MFPGERLLAQESHPGAHWHFGSVKKDLGELLHSAWTEYNGDVRQVANWILNSAEPSELSEYLYRLFAYQQLLEKNQPPTNLDSGNSAAFGHQHHTPKPTLQDCKNLVTQVATEGAQRVCSVAFRPGDIVWNCKQCQKDDTCVLCQTCFSNSNHDGHDVFFYQVMTTGGGCCDCGDPDAWDAKGFCVNHGERADIGEPEDSLPADLITSTRVLFDTVVEFIVAHSHLRPAQLMLKHVPGVSLKEYETLARSFLNWSDNTPVQGLQEWYNINQLIEFAQTTFGLAEVTAANVMKLKSLWGNKYADMIEVVDTSIEAKNKIVEIILWLLEVCQASDAISRLLCKALTEDSLTDTDSKQLKSSNPNMVSLNSQGASNNGDDRVGGSNVGEKLGGVSVDESECAVETSVRLAQRRASANSPFGKLGALLINDVSLPDDVSVALHRLYMRLLVDGLFKERYAIAFAKTYCDVCREFVTLPPSKKTSQNENTIFGLSVQFLNRSTFVETLVFEHGLLDSLIKSLVVTLASAWDVKSLTYLSQSTRQMEIPQRATVRTNHEVITLRKYSHIVTDLRYVLQIPGMSRYLCLHQHNLFHLWCLSLASAQGVDGQVRRTDTHIEYASEDWVHAFNLNLSLTSIFPYLLQWLHDSKLGVSECLAKVVNAQLGNDDAAVWKYGIAPQTSEQCQEQHALAICSLAEIGAENLCRWLNEANPVRKSLEWKTAPAGSGLGPQLVMKWDKNREPVSFHAPLHRFMGFILRAGICSSTDPDVYLQLLGKGSQEFWVGVSHFPLRCLVFAAQIQAGMWRRNGTPMENQLLNYSMVPLCRHSRDLDHVILQLSALNMTSGHFFSNVLHSFGVSSYFFDGWNTNGGTVAGMETEQQQSGAFAQSARRLQPRMNRTFDTSNLGTGGMYPPRNRNISNNVGMMRGSHGTGLPSLPSRRREQDTHVHTAPPPQSPASVPGIPPQLPDMVPGLLDELGPGGTIQATHGALADSIHNVLNHRIEANSALTPLVEALLSLIVVTVTELPVPSKSALENVRVGRQQQPEPHGEEESKYDQNPASVALVQLRREVVHRLATSPCAFSVLMECCYIVTTHGSVDATEDELKSVLNQVAVLKESSDGMEAAKFTLRDQSWNLYDPLYYHLTLESHEKAREQWLSKRRTLNTDVSYLLSSKKGYFPGDALCAEKTQFAKYSPSPAVGPPPDGHPAFAPVRQRLLYSEPLLVLLRTILIRAVGAYRREKRPSGNKTDKKPADEQSNWHETERVPPTLIAIVLHILTLQIHCLSMGINSIQEPEVTDESVGTYEWCENGMDRYNQIRIETSDTETFSNKWWKKGTDPLSGESLSVFECLRDMWIHNSIMEPGNRESLRWILMKASRLDDKFNIALENAYKSNSNSKKSSRDKSSRKRKAQLRAMDRLRQHQLQAMNAFAEHMDALSDDELMQDVTGNDSAGSVTQEMVNSLGDNSTNPSTSSGATISRRRKSSAGTSVAGDFSTSLPICVSCRENMPDHPIGYIAFAQRSSVLTRDSSASLMRWGVDCGRLMVHQCGHAIHFSCWTSYCASLLRSNENNLVVDLAERLEFLCPLCKSISNVIVPCIPHEMQGDTDTGNFDLTKPNTKLESLTREEDMAAIKKACSWLVDTDGFEMSSFKQMFTDDLGLGLGMGSSDAPRGTPQGPAKDPQFDKIRSILQQVALVLYETDKLVPQTVVNFLFKSTEGDTQKQQASLANAIALQPEWTLCLWYSVAYTVMSTQVSATKAKGVSNYASMSNMGSENLLHLLRVAQAAPIGSLDVSLFYKFVTDKLNRCLNPIYDLDRPPVVYDVSDQLASSNNNSSASATVDTNEDSQTDPFNQQDVGHFQSRLFAIAANQVGPVGAALGVTSHGTYALHQSGAGASMGLNAFANVLSRSNSSGGFQGQGSSDQTPSQSEMKSPNLDWFLNLPALCTSPELLLTLISLCKHELAENLVVILYSLKLLQALIDPCDETQTTSNHLAVDVVNVAKGATRVRSSSSVGSASRERSSSSAGSIGALAATTSSTPTVASDDFILCGMTEEEITLEAQSMLSIRDHVLKVLQEHRRIRVMPGGWTPQQPSQYSNDSPSQNSSNTQTAAPQTLYISSIASGGSQDDPVCVHQARALWQTPRDMVLNVRRGVLPFLHVVKLLLEAFQRTGNTSDLAETDFATLTKQLKVPRCTSLANNPFLLNLVKGWASRSAEYIFTQTSLFEPSGSDFSQAKLQLPSRRVRHALRPLYLVPLPNSYTELYAATHAGICELCQEPAHDRAICLVCGKVLVAGGACIRGLSKGECSRHVMNEHGGVGIVFLLQRCNVLLIRGPRAAYWPSLFVDRHGEEHRGTSRGLPMFLDRNRYERVQQLWLSHHVPREITLKRNRAQAVIRSNYY